MYLVFTFPDCGELAAESVVPLKLHGQWMRDRGWSNPVEVVFMTGFDTLSEGYKQDLIDLGYRLTDMSVVTKAIEDEYPAVKSMQPYFRYTFLRWVLLLEMVKRGLVNLPAITLGGDVFFTTDPIPLYEEVKSKTFVLQGCPDFVSISNVDWLEIYQSELLKYLSSPYDYHELKQFELADKRDDRQFCNLSCYEFPLRHDQDLIEYLIQYSVLPQETTYSALFDSKYFFIQNPLFPKQWAIEQIGDAPFHLNELNGQFFVANKLLAIIHLQNNFANCALAWMGLNKIGLGFTTRMILSDYIMGKPYFPAKLSRKVGLMIMQGSKTMSRRDIAQLLFSKSNSINSWVFLDVLNSFSRDQVPSK